MEQSASSPDPSVDTESSGSITPTGQQDRAVLAMIAGIERLDELDLASVEPATAFLWT